MIIIKNPPRQNWKGLEVACFECKAVLFAEVADFKREYYSDFRESWDFAVVDCPCCDTRIKVVKELIPEAIYEKFPPA